MSLNDAIEENAENAPMWSSIVSRINAITGINWRVTSWIRDSLSHQTGLAVDIAPELTSTFSSNYGLNIARDPLLNLRTFPFDVLSSTPYAPFHSIITPYYPDRGLAVFIETDHLHMYLLPIHDKIPTFLPVKRWLVPRVGIYPYDKEDFELNLKTMPKNGHKHSTIKRYTDKNAISELLNVPLLGDSLTPTERMSWYASMYPSAFHSLPDTYPTFASLPGKVSSIVDKAITAFKGLATPLGNTVEEIKQNLQTNYNVWATALKKNSSSIVDEARNLFTGLGIVDRIKSKFDTDWWNSFKFNSVFNSIKQSLRSIKAVLPDKSIIDVAKITTPSSDYNQLMIAAFPIFKNETSLPPIFKGNAMQTYLLKTTRRSLFITNLVTVCSKYATYKIMSLWPKIPFNRPLLQSAIATYIISTKFCETGSKFLPDAWRTQIGTSNLERGFFQLTPANLTTAAKLAVPMLNHPIPFSFVNTPTVPSMYDEEAAVFNGWIDFRYPMLKSAISDDIWCNHPNLAPTWSKLKLPTDRKYPEIRIALLLAITHWTGENKSVTNLPFTDSQVSHINSVRIPAFFLAIKALKDVV